MNSKEINSRLNGSNLMNNNMNNNYRIESNSGLKASTLMNNNMNNNYRIESNSGLKASTLRNNKTVNNKYRITIQDTPVQNTSKTYVETPRMRRSTCLSEIKSGLKESALSNNKTMNNDYRTTIMDVETPRMRRSSCPLNIKSGLMESALSNNKTMNNNRTYILDEPVPDIGVPTLSPTPFRRIVRSLRDTAKKAANTAKRKWNKYYDWLSTYVPPNSLKGSALRNNNIMDESVPDIGVPTLRPTPFRRRVQSLKETSRKVVNKVKKKWNDFHDWIIDYVPPAIRVNPSSAIEKLKNHIRKLYQQSPDFTPVEKKAAKGYFKTFTIPGNEYKDPKLYLTDVTHTTTRLIESNLNKGTKVKVALHCEMVRVDPDTKEDVYTTCYFNSNLKTIIQKDTVTGEYRVMSNEILENVANFQRRGSGWIFRKVLSMDIHLNKYEPLSGSSYIPLPKVLQSKGAIINVLNKKDNECFKWAVTSALYPAEKHPERQTKYIENSKKFNWDGINFPASFKDIDKFEKQNPSISINVFSYEEEVYPLRITKKANDKTVNLLLISKGENQHYCWIKNMSRLLTSQISKHRTRRFYCLRCLNSFYTAESLQKHELYCSNHDVVKIELPNEENNTLSFNNYNKSMRVPFVIYADFEAFTQKLDDDKPRDNKSSYTSQYEKHSPSGFCYYIKCSFDESYDQKVMYTKRSEDEDVSQIFVERLEYDIRRLYHRYYKFPKKLFLTEEDLDKFEKATKCHICDKPLGKDRVRDHCHLTGKFRGAAHNGCNINYKIPKFFPVIFHNLSGYDSHLFIKNLGTTGGNISCIPNNEEKYISFTKRIIVDTFNKDGKDIDVKRDIRFIDSFKFMACGLSSLVDNLDEYPILSKHFEGRQLELLGRKGVYPYEYMDRLSKLAEKQLPPINRFYSHLSDEGISEDDYQHAQNVWEEFKIKSMRGYHDLYLESDVLLLADVFENFRNVCLTNYKLDPAWYFTSPGIAWDAALKMTGVELELLTDPDMLLMIEKGVRGGVSMISKRHGKANNKYMKRGSTTEGRLGEEYDPSQPSKYITYLDANNLYGWAMSKPLPISNFKWMKNLHNWRNRPCILEVDLEYPEELHDLHNEYPLAPESLNVGNVDKLIPNLMNKERYVLHRDNLLLYESLGIKIKKIHRGITFVESPWLKEYIDLNTGLRAKATNTFEKDFFKLMNNSVFGKTMENIRNRVDIKLITNEKEAKKLISKPNFHHRTIFTENLIAVHMKKTKVYYNKPIYLGMCILDLSKTLMYDFHYNYIKKKYGEGANLLFTDTDSLAYEIDTEDFYKDINPDVERLFDTSNYPANHESGIKVGTNKKVPGMFKDEAGGKQILEFVGLRAKLYSYRMKDYEEKKCKGVKKAVVRKSIHFEDYKKCLLDGQAIHRTMNIIRSHQHEVYSERVNKVALSREDDKRIILEDGIHTLAHGHHKS